METIFKKILVPSENIVAREIEGELIIIPLVSGIGDLDNELFTLNDTGKVIWKKLDGKNTIQDVITALTSEFDASEDIITKDVVGLIEELTRRRMLVEA